MTKEDLKREIRWGQSDLSINCGKCSYRAVFHNERWHWGRMNCKSRKMIGAIRTEPEGASRWSVFESLVKQVEHDREAKQNISKMLQGHRCPALQQSLSPGS